jgi:hypothetical protein
LFKLLGGIDRVLFQIDEIFDKIVDSHIASKEIGPIDKLKFIEVKTSELLEMRTNIIKYGDLNLQKELKDTENLLDRNRKNAKLQKKRDEEKQEKINRQMKSNLS